MKVQPLVSILIISYNQEEYIGEALAGALEQDYGNLEVVIADDGSQDGTADRILEYAEKFPPGRLVPLVGGPNLGITGNSNRALRACHGKYIAFQGGDDVMLPGKISAQVKWLETDESRVLCGHGVEVIRPDGYVELAKVTNQSCVGRGYLDFIKTGKSPLKTVSIMVRASRIPSYGFDERVSLVSDWKMWVDCLRKDGLYGIVDGIFARYRLHSNNITTTRSLDCIRDGMHILQVLIDESDDEQAKKVLHRNMANSYLLLSLSQMRANNIIVAIKNARKGFFLDPKIFLSRFFNLFFNRMKRIQRRKV